MMESKIMSRLNNGLNRTRVELKLPRIFWTFATLQGLNRTRVELKYFEFSFINCRDKV